MSPSVLANLPRPMRKALSASPRALARAVRNPPRQELSLGVLVAASLFGLLCSLRFGANLVPPSMQAVPLLAGALVLGRRALLRLIGVVLLATLGVYFGRGVVEAPLGALVVVLATALFAWESARSRDETGLGGVRGGSVLVELRRRLEQQGRLPALPGGWNAECVVRPAGDGPFSGDFVVSSLSGDDSRFELALVDVSGKGVDAGTRALLLSGALGGLLGRASEHFLQSANAYLVRQDWEEGFATAVHLVLDLRTGDYAVDSAGHPPVAQFDASTGRWSLADADGVVLGLLPDVSYTASRGRLDRGDALILYTDGLVEIPGRDLSVGIDKLLGEAERLVPVGFEGGADTLVTRVAGTSPDDRGLVLIWRSS